MPGEELQPDLSFNRGAIKNGTEALAESYGCKRLELEGFTAGL